MNARARPRLLIVHHTPSPALHTMFEAVRDGARDPQLSGVEVTARPALGATVSDVLATDGLVLGTPANLGSMSGALKHFFDTIYYPCLDATRGRPFGLYVHGNEDVDSAVTAIEKITTGLRWRMAYRPVLVRGTPTRTDIEACSELGATLAALLGEGLG